MSVPNFQPLMYVSLPGQHAKYDRMSMRGSNQMRTLVTLLLLNIHYLSVTVFLGQCAAIKVCSPLQNRGE